MPGTKNHQSSKDIFQQQTNTQANPKRAGAVWQDKYAPKRVRTGTPQPVTPKSNARTRASHTKPHRTQTSSTKRQTVQVAAWVKHPIRDELQRIAKKEGLSLSATMAALLEEAIRQKLHLQQGTLLEPLLDSAIGKHMRSYSNRIALLIVRSLFASEQSRILTTNVLGRQPGMTQPVLDQLLDNSSDVAKHKLTHLTPQLEELIAEIQHWMEEGTAQKT